MTSFLKPGVVPDPVSAQPPYIPRILWQTTRDKTKILPDLAACIDKLKAGNPLWEHRLYDDASQLAELSAVCSDRFMRAYARIQPRYGAARADLFRYVMVYLHGGAYLDLKSGTTRPLDEILHPEDRFVISQWDNGPGGMFPKAGLRKTLKDIPKGEYEQWFVIAEPGHPFLKATIERVMHNIENYNPYVHGYGGKGVLIVMGPDAYTRAIRSLEDQYPTRHICAWEDGLRYTVLPGLETHQKLDKGHYSHTALPPVTNLGLTGTALLRYNLLNALYWPVAKLRILNHARMARRNARINARKG